jgi:hypothetical protein
VWSLAFCPVDVAHALWLAQLELADLKTKIVQVLKERVAVDDDFVLRNVLTSDVWLYQDLVPLFHNALFSVSRL